MGISFGSFNEICQTAALVICPLVGTDQGIEPVCYIRTVDVGGTLIFQPCECVVPGASGLPLNRFFLCLFWSHEVVMVLTAALSSNMLRAYSRDNNDRYYDLPYSGRVHRRRSASCLYPIRDA